jgi:selenocysteine-specific elongation factor
VTLVVGTAGHIDHGKTTLLRALTGIDADRLPEERRRGMTIDVGYAHLALDDGTMIDFVDVPGHDKLVGNMLVGAGEIDAAMLVVAADDGPRAQTLEHVALLDALGVAPGVAVVTKIDAVEPDRVATVVAAVTELLASTSLAGSPVVAASGVTGAGLDEVRARLAGLAAAVAAPSRPATLAIDRVFAVKGRGAVVTGTLRGGPLARGDTLRLVPGDRDVRVREIQVHGTAVDAVDGGGRTALNLAGIGIDELHRGMVLTADPAVHATDRALVTFQRSVADRTRARFHTGTDAADASIGRAGRDALDLPDGTVAGIVRLSAHVALAPGDRFVLRRGPAQAPVGGIVLDVAPPRGISRRRQTVARVANLAGAAPGARLDLHGVLPERDETAVAPDVRAIAAEAAIAAVGESAGVAPVRAAVASTLRRAVTVTREQAALIAGRVLEAVVAEGRLVRDGDVVRRPGSVGQITDPGLAAAMDRLEALLATPAPPSLAEAARAAACPADAVRALERSARIVVLGPDLAYAMSTYRDLVARAVAMAERQPLTPAAYRDATGTSRKYVMAILEDLDRRAILRRTPAGHVPGPKGPRPAGSVGTAGPAGTAR